MWWTGARGLRQRTEPGPDALARSQEPPPRLCQGGGSRRASADPVYPRVRRDGGRLFPRLRGRSIRAVGLMHRVLAPADDEPTGVVFLLDVVRCGDILGDRRVVSPRGDLDGRV